MNKIRVGSRESRLAVLQTQLIIDQIKKGNPGLEIELVTMKTTGDMFLDRTLDKIGGKGLFVKELDTALANHDIDIAVHSLKDMPMELSEELPILAFSKREDERDVLVLPKGTDHWNKALPIGCASFRRRIQLKRLYPDMETALVRGNVLTRLEKLDKGEYGALVLAAAGLKRLGLEERISKVFSPAEMIPSAGQGVLAIQGRADDDQAYLSGVNHLISQTTSLAERAYVKYLNGGCSSPIAAHGVVAEDTLTLSALYYQDGMEDYQTGSITGAAGDAETLGITLAKQLSEQL